MTATKTRISATVSKKLAKMLNEISKNSPYSKSALIEMALRKIFEEQLAKDAETLASLQADDLPTEEEWLIIGAKIED